MECVLYSYEMEPITIIDLEPDWYDFLWHHRTLHIPIIQPLTPQVFTTDEPTTPEPIDHDILTIHASVLWTPAQTQTLILYTQDEVNALQLRAGILAGQRKEWEEQFREGIREGFRQVMRFW